MNVHDILVLFAILFLLLGVDDLLLDFIAHVRRLRPRRLSTKEVMSLSARPEKRIAIIVPAWHESQIIRQMLMGNCDRILYSRYDFFVGVYPNDPATVAAVRKASSLRENIHAVVNSRPGPTSKGQMLNEVVRHIFEMEREKGITFDALLMQDAEDIIHPQMLRLMNTELEEYDFVQTPVFSLEVKRHQLVASTYMDEFAESHTKDLLVRSWLGAAVPSAGVGTGLSRRLVTTQWEKQGYLFKESSLTEDYELGVQIHGLGLRPKFVCAMVGRDYIATREYFPKRFSRSVRQKTRWSVGICLQGWRNIGWAGSLLNRYFLYRDRKGLISNVLGMVGYFFLGILLFSFTTEPEALEGPWVTWLGGANLGLMVNRFLQRARSVAMVYGMWAALTIPFTWPVANLINALASMNALRQDLVNRLQAKAHTWAKTEHELPELFGAALH